MADSLQSTFERIQISEEDLSGAGSSEVNIPILSKSLDATSQSVKLRDISPVCVLVVGMAGSGKTTLMAALQRSLGVPAEAGDDGEQDDKDEENSEPIGYCLNLDPATVLVPFGASIDIRDTVDYKVRRWQSNFNHTSPLWRKGTTGILTFFYFSFLHDTITGSNETTSPRSKWSHHDFPQSFCYQVRPSYNHIG
jgi:hypothetical protein